MINKYVKQLVNTTIWFTNKAKQSTNMPIQLAVMAIVLTNTVKLSKYMSILLTKMAIQLTYMPLWLTNTAIQSTNITIQVANMEIQLTNMPMWSENMK